MSRFVMIVLLSLHRGETLSFSAYELLVTLLSCNSGGYSHGQVSKCFAIAIYVNI